MIKKERYIFVLLIINYAITYYAFCNPKLSQGLCELSFPMVIGVICYISIFYRFDKKIKNNEIVNLVISFIGKRTFGIYIIHMFIFQYMTKNSLMSLERESIIEVLFILIMIVYMMLLKK